MLALLMTYSDDWVFHRDHLMKVAQIGRDKFQRVMRELITAGYVSREAIRGEGGQVSGSTWFINDDPDREPENPVPGVTEDLINRQPEKPTAGFSGTLRRTTDKKTKREECVQASSAKAFMRFWRAYPRPRDQEKSQKVFSALVSQGVDPERLVAAAEDYRRDNKGNAAMYLCFSDNWLTDGRWKTFDQEAPSAASGTGMAATARLLAEKAKSGKRLFGVSNDVKNFMLQHKLVSEDELRRAGVE